MKRFSHSAKSMQRQDAKTQRLGCAVVAGLCAFAPLRDLLFRVGVAVAVAGSPLSAAPPVRGEIRKDTVWQGVMHISADIAIGNAELRLLPGTTVLFDKPNTMGEGPVILLNAPVAVYKQGAAGARLTMIGTAEQPIVIETPEGKPRGSILCGRSIMTTVTARHVIFRRMGRVIGRGVVEPAVQINMSGNDDDAWFTDCQFEDCGPLNVECQAERATLDIRGCRFERSAGTTAINIGGLGPGSKVIAHTRADAGLQITCPQILVHDNILVGPMAGIDIASPGLVGLRIIDNWISLESEPLWGRAALSCASTAVTVAGNVLHGGSRVVDAAASRIVGNAIVGVRYPTGTQPGQSSQPASRETASALLNLSDQRSEVTDNYLFGPCHESISLGRTTRGTVIRHNLFDGLDSPGCALGFHELPTVAPGVDLACNLFLRYKKPPVVNPSRQTGALIEAADNAFVMTPKPGYQGIGNLAELSVRERYVTNLETDAGDLDAGWRQHQELQAALLQGSIGFSEARARLCAGYQRICRQFNTDPPSSERVGPRPGYFDTATTQAAEAASQPDEPQP